MEATFVDNENTEKNASVKGLDATKDYDHEVGADVLGFLSSSEHSQLRTSDPRGVELLERLKM